MIKFFYAFITTRLVRLFHTSRSKILCWSQHTYHHWSHPLKKEGLPTGWERIDSPEYEVYYVNHITRQAQYQHPCYPSEMQTVSRVVPPTQHTNFHSHSVLVPANPYINEEIRHWLFVYSRASADLDCKLRWELFRLPELYWFNAMLIRLLTQEVKEIVMRNKKYRNALGYEIEQRMKETESENNNGLANTRSIGAEMFWEVSSYPLN